MNYLTQGGVAAIIIYLVLKEVFPFVLKMKNGNGYSNGRSDKADLVEYGELRQQVKNLAEGQREVAKIVGDLQKDVIGMAGSIKTITEIIKRVEP